MRAHVPSYQMKAPKSLRECLEILKHEPGVWQPFAGGTDLMVLFEAGKLAHKKFLSLWHLTELQEVETSEAYLSLGALTTFSQIQANLTIKNEFPLLARAAADTGARAIQNRGTLGGNIANASPAADSPPVLLLHEAELELVSADESRWINYGEFHLGYKKTALRPGELISRIRLPRNTAGYRSYYKKVGTRRAQAISKVCFAGLAETKAGHSSNFPATFGDVRIALGSVAPTSIRCSETESVIRGEKFSEKLLSLAQETLQKEIAPISDIRSTADFRMQVSLNLLGDFLRQGTCGTG